MGHLGFYSVITVLLRNLYLQENCRLEDEVLLLTARVTDVSCSFERLGINSIGYKEVLALL